MTKRKFEQQLKEQAYTAVPDMREDLLKTVAAQDAAVVSLSDSEDEPHLVPVVPAIQARRRWMALVACFAVVLVAVLVAVTTGDGNGELMKKEPEEAAATTTVGGAVDPFASVSTMPSDKQKGRGVTTASGSVSGDTNVTGAASGSLSGGTNVTGTASGSASGGTATLSAVSGTQTTNASGAQTTNASVLPFSTGSSRISGTVSGGTKQKGATTVTTRSTSKFWGDFSVSTTKKKDSGDATTQKTIAPSAKPTTKPTTAPTTRPTEPTCNHMIEYRVPVSWDGQPVPAADTCVNQVTPTEPTVAPTEPPAAPTQRPPVVKDGFTYTVTYSVPAAQTYGVPYRIYTEVVFNDGWKTQYWSSCDGTTVLYTNIKTTTKSGVCTYEQTYNQNSQLLTIIRRNQDGAITYQNTRSVPIGDSRFLVID